MSKKLKWEIDALPFVWGVQHEPRNSLGLPDELPFVLTFDERSGLVVQEFNKAVAAAVSDAYRLGSVLGSNVDEDGVGRLYADDFLSFIHGRLSDNVHIPRSSVLEIGCGNGYLLSRLKDTFGTVLGVEPGPQGQEGAKRYGVEIIRDFFPSPRIADSKYSIIILASVFEHVENPVGLAASLAEYLEPGGRVFVSVPDEESYIYQNDVSTLFHEHWSYFDQRTLKNTMALAGFSLECCEKSSFGGSIYAELSPSINEILLSEADYISAVSAAKNYICNSELCCNFLRDACANMCDGGRTLGVYVPARFVNAMRISGTPGDRIRFFDDDPQLLGTYYPGIPIAVENREALLNNPVDTLLIMSRTFGHNLAEKLKIDLPPATKIILIADLLG